MLTTNLEKVFKTLGEVFPIPDGYECYHTVRFIPGRGICLSIFRFFNNDTEMDCQDVFLDEPVRLSKRLFKAIKKELGGYDQFRAEQAAKEEAEAAYYESLSAFDKAEAGLLILND